MTSAPYVRRCADCFAELSPGLRACPSCHRLVHGEELKAIAAEAERVMKAGDAAGALAQWTRALELLPEDSRQHAIIRAKVTELRARTPSTEESSKSAGDAAPDKSRWAKRAGPLGAIGLFLWKVKWLFLFVLTKGKLLLLGLTKASTVFSMLLSFGFYFTVFGWKFALGLVLSIYVHEMGHVAALKRYGIAATAPMFIPGLGAVVRLKEYPATPGQDARVGLAGPLWGLLAAAACYAIFLAGGSPTFAALARAGAFINMFNLLPVWQLDGSRGFRALSRKQRLLVVLTIGAAWFATGESMLLLLLLAAGARTVMKDAPPKGDLPVLGLFVVLVALLAALSGITVPGAAASP